MPRPVGEAHGGEQLAALGLDGGVYLLFLRLVVRALLRQQLGRERDVLQRRVLREEVEALEHQPEVQPLAAHVRLAARGGVGGVEEQLAVYGDAAAVRRLEEVEAAQQRGLAAAGGADYAQRLALLEGEADVVEHLRLVEVLLKVFDFQYGHVAAPLSEELELALQPAEQEGDDAVEHEVVYAREEQRPDEAGVGRASPSGRRSRPR